jgi:hypothetical protein
MKMFVVKFYENKNLLVTQLLKLVPSIGDSITIKGRKGKVSSISAEDGTNIHVQLTVEKVIMKSKLVASDPKKKKR